MGGTVKHHWANAKTASEYLNDLNGEEFQSTSLM